MHDGDEQGIKNPNFDDIYKIVVIGDSGVGKTSILNRFVENTFDENIYGGSIGVDYKSKVLTDIEGKKIKLNIWDTAGQETASLLTRSYFSHSQGALLVFDLSDKKSFNSIHSWLEEVDRYSNTPVIKILVGNKNDLNENAVPNAKSFADKNGFEYIEASAKTGNNLDLVFSSLATQISRKKEGKAGFASTSKTENKETLFLNQPITKTKRRVCIST